MSRDRDSIEEIDVGPSFDADSITIPDELRETSNFGQATQPRSNSASKNSGQRSGLLWIGLIAGAAALGVGAALIAQDSESLPESQPIAVEKEVPSAEKNIPPAVEKNDPTVKTAAVSETETPGSEPAPPPAAEPPLSEPPSEKKKTIREAPSQAVDRPTEKPVKKRKRRRKPKRSLDDALAKLQDFEEESDPEPIPAGIEPGGNTVRASAPLAPDVACAQGDIAACVKAGEAAEISNDGAKARQFFGIACAKKRGKACAALAGLLEKGVGGPANPKRAMSLRVKACEFGHQKSCASVKTTTSSTN